MFPEVAQQSDRRPSSMDEFMKFASSGPGIPPEMRAMGLNGEPTAEDIEKQMEAVRYSKNVLIKDIQVRTYNMSKEEDVEEYRTTYIDLYNKVAEGKILLKDLDKKFVSDGEGSRWLIHMEWMEYDLKVTDHQMTRDEDNGRGAPVQYRP